MADPPVPAPWTPVPLPSMPNPWPTGSPINTWDPTQLLQYIESTFAAQIKQSFGQSISLIDLIDLFKRFGSNNVTDQELVRLIEMGIYFARTKLGWTSAAANLEHWLDAGSSISPWIMSRDLVRNRDPITYALCTEYYDLIVTGVEKRIKATAGELFPSTTKTITSATGAVITLTPAASNLAAGAEENLYIEQSVATSGNHAEDIYNAVAAVWLDSRVKVKSEKLSSGGWRVTITEWECWFWDDYDWGLNGQSVVIPIHLFDNLGIPNEQRDLLKTYFGIDPAMFDEIKVADNTMLQIEGKQVNMPDGRQLHPKAYRIYGDQTWPFDPSGDPCSRPKSWEVH